MLEAVSSRVNNRVPCVTLVSPTASFAYDADGNRVWQKVGATETTYVWDWVESGTVYYYFGGRKVAAPSIKWRSREASLPGVTAGSTACRYSLRDGEYIDAHIMARLKE